MVTLAWIVQREVEHDGSFQLSDDSYKLTADRIFKAIACGNELSYSYEKNEFIPNILHNYKEGTELLGLYIIKYMIRNKATDLYAETYVEGDRIFKDIVALFVDRSDSQIRVDIWQSRLLYVISYFYSSGLLLRSIYDIENITEKQIKREYNGAYKLYLSPRGQALYKLLSQNALLLELYRDDIYTNLENNDKLTSDLNTDELMMYLVDYVSYLFQCEQKYIGNAISCLERYQELFGEELIVVPLFEGIIKNIRAFYPKRDDEYQNLMKRIRNQINKIKEYIDLIENEQGIRFSISQYLNNVCFEE